MEIVHIILPIKTTLQDILEREIMCFVDKLCSNSTPK